MLPLAAAIPLAFLPGVSDMFDAPRRKLFTALGADESGSGSSLLNSLLGVDQESDLGKYGGLAAEMIGDPLNLLSAGALGGARLAEKASQAGRMAGLQNELSAAVRMKNGVRDAEAMVPFGSTTIGDLPRGSSAAAELAPEAIFTPRRATKVGDLPPGYPDPTIATQKQARNIQDKSQSSAKKMNKAIREDEGGFRRADVNAEEVTQETMRENMAKNNVVRDREFAASGTQPVTPWETMSDTDKNRLAEILLSSPRLQSMLPAMNAPGRAGYAANFEPVIKGIMSDITSDPRRSALLDQLLTAAAGGTVGGMAGMRMMNE